MCAKSNGNVNKSTSSGWPFYFDSELHTQTNITPIKSFSKTNEPWLKFTKNTRNIWEMRRVVYNMFQRKARTDMQSAAEHTTKGKYGLDCVKCEWRFMHQWIVHRHQVHLEHLGTTVIRIQMQCTAILEPSSWCFSQQSILGRLLFAASLNKHARCLCRGNHSNRWIFCWTCCRILQQQPFEAAIFWRHQRHPQLRIPAQATWENLEK